MVFKKTQKKHFYSSLDSPRTASWEQIAGSVRHLFKPSECAVFVYTTNNEACDSNAL